MKPVVLEYATAAEHFKDAPLPPSTSTSCTLSRRCLVTSENCLLTIPKVKLGLSLVSIRPCLRKSWVVVFSNVYYIARMSGFRRDLERWFEQCDLCRSRKGPKLRMKCKLKTTILANLYNELQSTLYGSCLLRSWQQIQSRYLRLLRNGQRLWQWRTRKPVPLTEY